MGETGVTDYHGAISFVKRWAILNTLASYLFQQLSLPNFTSTVAAVINPRKIKVNKKQLIFSWLTPCLFEKEYVSKSSERQHELTLSRSFRISDLRIVWSIVWPLQRQYVQLLTPASAADRQHSIFTIIYGRGALILLGLTKLGSLNSIPVPK